MALMVRKTDQLKAWGPLLQSTIGRQHRRFDTIADTELFHNGCYIALDRLVAQSQLFADLTVAKSVRYEGKDLFLACRQFREFLR